MAHRLPYEASGSSSHSTGRAVGDSISAWQAAARNDHEGDAQHAQLDEGDAPVAEGLGKKTMVGNDSQESKESMTSMHPLWDPLESNCSTVSTDTSASEFEPGAGALLMQRNRLMVEGLATGLAAASLENCRAED